MTTMTKSAHLVKFKHEHNVFAIVFNNSPVLFYQTQSHQPVQMTDV